MTPTVLLFDIDGTLVSTGGAGRRAMIGAFAALYGRADVFEDFNFAGMTDRAIARHGLGRAGLVASADEIDRMLGAYLDLLDTELAASKGYRVLPGVEALLGALARRDRGQGAFAIGLGTGNVERGAYAKLTRGAIDGAFAFGGFGSDAEDRTELLRAGARRGAQAVSATLEECRVVVIGDTPKDVAAAQGIGAECVGVGTGSYTPEDLARCGATRAFATLAERDVLEVLSGRP